MKPSACRALRPRLLAWYDAHRRDLPWRSGGDTPPDPYRVWLSEVMLQQTRVETVKPYYTRWLARFPTLASLAAAPLDDVLKAWEGLGYYSRGRNLHRAAREVADRHAGQVPGDPAAFRALPGVGRYTAGAVLSIAFGLPEPVVDGNVRRVFSRWMDDPRPTDGALWELASRMVPGERPGDLNQALMELGATVCTPRAPRCLACPVADLCAARAAGTQHDRPARRNARPVPRETQAVAVVEREGRYLIARRPVDTRLGGLWEFPGTLRARGESAGRAAERAVREGLGLEVRAGGPIAVVVHRFTHVEVSYEAVRCQLLAGEERPLGYDAWTWATPERLQAHALPVAQRKIAALALEPSLFA